MDSIYTNNSCRAYANYFVIDFFKYAMKIKTKQKLYIAQGENISVAEIIGIYTHCTYVRCGTRSTTVPTFINRRFYGVGYDESGNRTLFLKNWWHYYPATITENIRKKLTHQK